MSENFSGEFKDRKATFDGFACHCGEENQAQMERLHRWVMETFYEAPGKELHADWVQDNYVTAMLYTLAGSYDAWITDVPLDPGGWGAIVTEAVKSKYDVGTPLEAHVQFDRFEDGLALTIWAMYQKYGKRRERRQTKEARA